MSEKRNGSARFTDYDGYLAWYSSLETLDAMDAAHDQMRKATKGQREGYKRSRVDSAVDRDVPASGRLRRVRSVQGDSLERNTRGGNHPHSAVPSLL